MSSSSSQSKNISLKSCGVIRAEEGATTFFCFQKGEFIREEGRKRNRQCMKFIFTLMLVSFGAGCRMVNMLNKIGLTLHWLTIMNFLDKQLQKKIEHVKLKTPQYLHLLLLMDNINIYCGNKIHHR